MGEKYLDPPSSKLTLIPIYAWGLCLAQDTGHNIIKEVVERSAEFSAIVNSP